MVTAIAPDGGGGEAGCESTPTPLIITVVPAGRLVMIMSVGDTLLKIDVGWMDIGVQVGVAVGTGVSVCARAGLTSGPENNTERMVTRRNKVRNFIELSCAPFRHGALSSV
jgi:hypothetical protein